MKGSKSMQIYSIKLKRIYVFFLFIVVFCNAQSSSKEGPFDKLIIANAMIIPGHGGPAYGPADIIIEKNRIVQIISYNGKTLAKIRVQPSPEPVFIKHDNTDGNFFARIHGQTEKFNPQETQKWISDHFKK